MRRPGRLRCSEHHHSHPLLSLLLVLFDLQNSSPQTTSTSSTSQRTSGALKCVRGGAAIVSFLFLSDDDQTLENTFCSAFFFVSLSPPKLDVVECQQRGRWDTPQSAATDHTRKSRVQVIASLHETDREFFSLSPKNQNASAQTTLSAPLLLSSKKKNRRKVGPLTAGLSFRSISSSRGHDLGFRPQRDLPHAHGGLPPHLGRLPGLRRPDDAGGAAAEGCWVVVDVGGIGVVDRCLVLAPLPPRLRPLRRGPAARRAQPAFSDASSERRARRRGRQRERERRR